MVAFALIDVVPHIATREAHEPPVCYLDANGSSGTRATPRSNNRIPPPYMRITLSGMLFVTDETGAGQRPDRARTDSNGEPRCGAGALVQ